jgi:opacity protein-like surface antigen
MLSSIHCHCNWPVIHPQLNQLATAATAALLLGALPAAAAPAQQPRHWYATLAAGALQPQTQSGYVETHYGYAISGSVQRSAGFNGEAGIGYSFGAIRTELTYAYTSNSLVSSQASAMGISEKTKGLSGYTTTNAFLGSAYWDFTNQSRFTPYLGGGFGYGLIYQSPATFQMGYGGSVGPSAYISVPAYQGKAGVSYRASKALDVFVEAVYRGTTGYDGESGFTPNASQNGPLNYWGGNLGFRFKIGRQP